MGTRGFAAWANVATLLVIGFALGALGACSGTSGDDLGATASDAAGPSDPATSSDGGASIDSDGSSETPDEGVSPGSDAATTADAGADASRAGLSGASQATCSPSPCTPGPAPTMTDGVLQVDDGSGTVQTRGYGVYRPGGLSNTASNKVPAVLVFAGSGNCAPTEIAQDRVGARLEPIADANRFIVIYMEKVSVGTCLTTWRERNVGDTGPSTVSDEPYVAGVVQDLLTKQNVDPQRIYATGTSAGGHFIIDIACDVQNSHLLRGIAVDSSSLSMPAGSAGYYCPSTNQKLFYAEIVGSYGIDQPLYAGGCPHRCFPSITAVGDWWAQHLGCGPVRVDSTFGAPTATNQRHVWTDPCPFAQNGGVMTIGVVGGAHTWVCQDSDPTAPPNRCNGVTPPTNGLYVGQELWSFFAHGLSH